MQCTTQARLFRYGVAQWLVDSSPGYDSHQASLTPPQKIFSQMQSPTVGDPREEEHQFTCTYVVRKITNERKILPGMATILRERTTDFRG
jgi:hypothetical protein